MIIEFPALLALIDQRSAAFRAAVAAAPGLDVQVPTCPEWTLLQLAEHLGGGDRFWADIVGAGPADAPSAEAAAARAAVVAPKEREALVAWLAESTERLLDALREAGPERGCWTWWGLSQSPRTSGAVARHRVQETSLHTYDAQLAAGTPQPLPLEVALDGVDEFLTTICATTIAWPHEPATLDFHAAEGRSWRLELSAEGARASRLSAPAGPPPTAAARATAAGLALGMWGREPLSTWEFDGAAQVFELLYDWEPEQ